MHQAMAAALDKAFEQISAIQAAARDAKGREIPAWPMIVLRSPKGGTGPKTVDGLKTEGFWRSHHVPFSDMAKAGHLQLLEDWMRSYQPEELFDETGCLRPEVTAIAPEGTRRMSGNPNANGGALMRPLRLPDFKLYAVAVTHPGGRFGSNATTRKFLAGCDSRKCGKPKLSNLRP